ncbi:MAG TPA: tetratricopeptide repeat protein [Tepidisphaeraceae bacterium]|nr:tetratricopeptide repeat protein [Tepidisphaeraceae bacterium]
MEHNHSSINSALLTGTRGFISWNNSLCADKKKMNPRRWTIGIIVLTALGGCAASSNSGLDSAGETHLSAQTYYAAGQLAESQKDWPRAIAEYRQAINAKGPHAPAMYRIAMIYTQTKDYSRAIESWKQYVSATYGAATAYGDLAHCYELAGKYAQAEQSYKEALAKEPANPTCRVNYGLMLARQGKIDEAENQMRGILSEAQIHYDLGIVCEQTKKTQQARSEYAQAIKLDPQMMQARERLANLDSTTAAAK